MAMFFFLSAPMNLLYELPFALRKAPIFTCQTLAAVAFSCRGGGQKRLTGGAI